MLGQGQGIRSLELYGVQGHREKAVDIDVLCRPAELGRRKLDERRFEVRSAAWSISSDQYLQAFSEIVLSREMH